MNLLLRILSDLIPLLASVTLIVAGAYCPLLYRSKRALIAYGLAVVLFSIVFSVIWVQP